MSRQQKTAVRMGGVLLGLPILSYGLLVAHGGQLARLGGSDKVLRVVRRGDG